MAKKINKFVLLPLFLGAVCLVSAGVIAGVNYFTEPRIIQNDIDKQNAGYYKVLGISSADAPIEITITDAHKAAGVTSINRFEVSGTLIGFVYDMNITGYSPNLKFQVGFKDGKFAGFNVISHSETPSYGGQVLSVINERIKDKEAGSDVMSLINSGGNITSGKSATSDALATALTYCATDYLAGGK